MRVQIKHIQPVVTAGIMAFMMTGFVTYINLGITQDFLFLWARTFFIAWPIASIAAFFAIPLAPKISRKLLALLYGTA